MSPNLDSNHHDAPRISDVIHRIGENVADLKTQTQVSNVKINRLEESIQDIRDVLSKLSDVYNAQVLLQKDLAQLNKEVISIKSKSDQNSADLIPIKNTIQNQINGVTYALKVGGVVISILYGIGVFFYNHAVEYTKSLDSRISQLESKVDTNTVNLRDYIKRMEWAHPEIINGHKKPN